MLTESWSGAPTEWTREGPKAGAPFSAADVGVRAVGVGSLHTGDGIDELGGEKKRGVIDTIVPVRWVNMSSFWRIIIMNKRR